MLCHSWSSWWNLHQRWFYYLSIPLIVADTVLAAAVILLIIADAAIVAVFISTFLFLLFCSWLLMSCLWYAQLIVLFIMTTTVFIFTMVDCLGF